MKIKTILGYIAEFTIVYLAIAISHPLTIIPTIIICGLYLYSFVITYGMIAIIKRPEEAIIKGFLNNEILQSIKHLYNEMTSNNSTRNHIFITDIAFVLLLGYFFHINPINSTFILITGILAFTTRYKFIKLANKQGHIVEQMLE